MSEIYHVPIDTEHSTVTFDHEFLSVLRAREMSPQIDELYSVGTIRHGSEESSGYVLAVVSHLEAPLDTVDVVNSERTETLICGCAGYYFNAYDSQVGAKIDDCKHCEKIHEKRRTELPEEQSTLIP